MSMSGFCGSEPQRSSSWMCEFHMPSTTFVSSIGATVRGGPGTSSFRLMDGSKHRSASGGGATLVCSSFSSRPRQAVSLFWALSCLFLAFFAAPAPETSEAECSSESASEYSPMNSSRAAAASAAAFPAGEPFSAFRSRSSLSFTSVGLVEKTAVSRSMPKRAGRKSSSSKMPAFRTISRAVRHATRNASTKAPRRGSGFACLAGSCR
mmetsp:Transcript_9040/g.26812  ORF Transcript_9040/g.26812 Transcript_9040/m.26812 type:complete len:208 (+) Transcript_9040:1126-1749(+)